MAIEAHEKTEPDSLGLAFFRDVAGSNVSFIRIFLVLLTTFACISAGARIDTSREGTIVLENAFIQRKLEYDGRRWRTIEFSRADGSDKLAIRSDEFHVLLPDDRQFTIGDYVVDGDPKCITEGESKLLQIRYRRVGRLGTGAPEVVVIDYCIRDEPYVRKKVTLEMSQSDAIDRLQVERFVAKAQMRRGGRGEPIFFNETWFGGLEYPASYNRFGKDFKYPDYKLRNPGKIDLQGRDMEVGGAQDGLVTMAHFPGLAKEQQENGRWGIESKVSVFGTGRRGDTIELAFMDYLNTVRRGKPRSYLHHNNWYDASGKDLSVENYIRKTYAKLRDNLGRYGVALDGMVPDNGWQNKRSIWQPKDSFDIEAVSSALKVSSKTGLGLWISLNGYNTDIEWGVSNGYVEAERNAWFTQFKRYYSLTHPKYNADLRKGLQYLITKGDVNYFKHDFNEMCDVGAGRGHLPTDRHGHEANVDAMIALLAYERQLQPDIYQNMTNWIWFSPWWLMHNDCLWMMGSDSGNNGAWPQLAMRDFATTFRDEHFARLWSDPLERPLIPISTLMTHGIILGDRKRRGDATETLHDWANYVMMYYGRGVMLKELYISPDLLSEDYWKVLGKATKWAVDNSAKLVNTVAIGGNPELGEAGGYISWTDDSGILTLRNPDRKQQTVYVPWDQRTWYRGPLGRKWRGRCVYPFAEPLSRQYASGKSFEMTVPGDSVMVFEFEPGTAKNTLEVVCPPVPKIVSRVDTDSFEVDVSVPDEPMLRCDLVCEFLGRAKAEFSVGGRVVATDRLNNGRVTGKREIRGGRLICEQPEVLGRLGAFREWSICGIDLRKYRGREVTIRCRMKGEGSELPRYDVWWVADRAVSKAASAETAALPFLIGQDHRRQTHEIISAGGEKR